MKLNDKTERIYKNIIQSLFTKLKDDFVNEGCLDNLNLLKEVSFDITEIYIIIKLYYLDIRTQTS